MTNRLRLLQPAAAAAGTAAVLFGCVKMIPVMQAVRIGPEYAAVSEREAEMPAPKPLISLHTQTEPETQSAEKGEQPLLIVRESAASAAMHSARPYENRHGSSGGSIQEKQYSDLRGSMFFSLDGGGQVRNSTFWSNGDLKAESRIRPALRPPTDGSPAVLIYHTHTTESFPDVKSDSYDAAFNFRTTEPERNMTAVGDAAAAALTAAGIGVVHAAEIHDYPKWNGSYARSAETVRAVLKEYPSVCIALDFHRDAISSGTTVIAPTAVIDGRKTAQVMIISGCDDGTMQMPDYRENFHFACLLQQTAEHMYPGLMRPILFDYRKYNQDLTTGSLLIEVGSQGNTLEEACRAGTLIGQALAETIRQAGSARLQ